MDKKKLRLSEEQLREWTEGHVTTLLAELCRAELERVENTPVMECLMAGEPDKTHENLVELEARARCFSEWVAFLEGDWDYLLEVDEDE